jgi:hypothetical protein
MNLISRLGQAALLDPVITLGQRAVQPLLRPAWLRDALHGVWLGHPLHPVLIQAPVGAWMSAAVLDAFPRTGRDTQRLVTFGLIASGSAALARLSCHQALRAGAWTHGSCNACASSTPAPGLRPRPAPAPAGLTMGPATPPSRSRYTPTSSGSPHTPSGRLTPATEQNRETPASGSCEMARICCHERPQPHKALPLKPSHPGQQFSGGVIRA